MRPYQADARGYLVIGGPSFCEVCGTRIEDDGRQTVFLVTEGSPLVELCEECRKAVDAPPKAKRTRVPWDAIAVSFVVSVSLVGVPTLAFWSLSSRSTGPPAFPPHQTLTAATLDSAPIGSSGAPFYQTIRIDSSVHIQTPMSCVYYEDHAVCGVGAGSGSV